MSDMSYTSINKRKFFLQTYVVLHAMLKIGIYGLYS